MHPCTNVSAHAHTYRHVCWHVYVYLPSFVSLEDSETGEIFFPFVLHPLTTSCLLVLCPTGALSLMFSLPNLLSFNEAHKNEFPGGFRFLWFFCLFVCCLFCDSQEHFNTLRSSHPVVSSSWKCHLLSHFLPCSVLLPSLLHQRGKQLFPLQP